MKIAIIHDWLDVYAGSERVLEQIINLYPNADLFSIVNFLDEKNKHFIGNKKVQTSFVQKIPFSRKFFRNYLPFMPLAIEQFDLTSYDLVISSSHAVAKGVITGPNQLHISYVHSPIRYAWDLQHQYLKESGLNKGIKRWVTSLILHKIRIWDYRTANGVDEIIANSNFIAKRIFKVYNRKATVIYPPVDVNKFALCENKDDYYLTASRLVPYKKVDLIVEAFSNMPDKKLIVIGTGSEFAKIKALAKDNIIMLGYQEDEVLIKYLQKAKAFIFAAEEDFGIIPVEAQACGTPVIAFGRGGVLETIRGIEHDNPTGVFFYSQTESSLRDAVNIFESISDQISPLDCRINALKFSPERFKNEFKEVVKSKCKEFINISNEGATNVQ